MSRTVEFKLSVEDVELVAEALDSHAYWQLSEERYRNDGYVLEPGSDDPDVRDQIHRTQEIEEKLRELLRAVPEGES